MPREKHRPPEIRAFFLGVGNRGGSFFFFFLLFKVSNTMNSMKFRRNLKNTMLISHKKPQERKKTGATGWAQPNLCQIGSFSTNFFGWWKMPKKESLKFHPIQIGWLHPIPLEKEVSPEKLSQRSDFTLSCLATRGTRFVGTRNWPENPESTALFWWGKRQLTQQYTTKIWREV